MAQCTSEAVHRDENGEAIRDHATGKSLKRPCKRSAIRGSNPPKCLVHCTPIERQKAMEAKFLQRHADDVSELLFALDIADMHPMDGLLEAMRLSGNMMRVFQVLASELTETPTIETTVSPEGVMLDREVPGIWGHDHNGDQASHVILTMLGTWTDRFTKACKMALDAGIDERIVRNAEATSITFLTAFERAIKSVQLTDVQRIALGQAMAKEVREALSASPKMLEVVTP